MASVATAMALSGPGCVSRIVGPGTASPVSGVARFQFNRRGVAGNGIGVVADLAVGRGGGRY